MTHTKNYWLAIAEGLEIIRRRLCPYPGTTCDCKFGINYETNLAISEQTGCPELKNIISIYRTAANQ